MQVARFVVDETPYACWDWDLKEKNLDFLRGIDAEYFWYVAEMNAEHLEGEAKHRAALAIRLAYSQGLEALFALLCSAIQAPECAVGWMLVYRPSDLRKLVSKINARASVLSRVTRPPVTWDGLAEHVHAHLPYEAEKRRWIQEGFAKLWRRWSRELEDESLSVEYNSVKHGLRARPGGFSLRIGKEKEYAVPPPEEEMKSLGGSVFGTSYFKVERIDGSRLNFRPRRESRNWDPGNMLNGLGLMSMSIKNTVSFLRILNGDPSNQCEFGSPDRKEAFDEPWRRCVGPISFGLDTAIGPGDIRACTKEEVVSSYSGATDDSS